MNHIALTASLLTRRHWLLGAATTMLAGTLPSDAFAQSAAFGRWVEAFRDRAVRRGISEATYNRVMNGLKPDTSVYEQYRRQPEFTESMWQYINRRCSGFRVMTGKDRAKEHAATSSPAPKPVEAPVAAPAFPALDASCTSDEDCTHTGRWSTCCGVCEQKYASKSYVATVDAYCKANPPEQCPPMGCSWGMATVHCVEGTCRDRPQ